MAAIIRFLRTDTPRYLLLGVAILFMLEVYARSLKIYLADLDRPLFMECAFLGSAFIACFYEFKGFVWKVSLTGCLVTLCLFAVGTMLACWLRVHYVEFVTAIKTTPELADVVGRDVYQALTARVVGYGGCFAAGMLIARLMLAKWIRKLMLSYFAPHSQSACPTCGGCGQLSS